MRSSNKSRNRSKNNNRRGSPGNNINRVFESAGPEGRVRGTPQQIIDKYLSLTYDSQLSGDRVAAENFQQHAEHYSRLLIEAQKEIAEKQAEQVVNGSSNKINTQGPENTNGTISEKSNLDEKQEDKIVKFDKTLENKVAGVKLSEQNEKSQKTASSKKIAKKSDVVDSETLEV